MGLVLLGILLSSSCVQTLLSSQNLALNFVSLPTWTSLVGPKQNIGFAQVVVINALTSLVAWIGGAVWLSRISRTPITVSLVRWGLFGWIWWCVFDLYEWVWVISGLTGWTGISELLSAVPQFWLAFCITGWIATFASLSSDDSGREGAAVNKGRFCIPARVWVWLACGTYIVVFVAMNWRLYFNLLIPHGDSAMYEEHLWNVLHGKGFRSYLDQGLFLGEHIQFVHLFLIPLYIFWPSHLLLELCESIALALGALPVYWLTLRQTRSDRVALATAVAYLLYAPMQFLDIEIDLKTFRPEAFGIPLLLLTLDQLDRRNRIGFLCCLGLTLTVKEDYSIVFGPLGLWIAARELWLRRQVSDAPREIQTANGAPQPMFERWWLIVGVMLAVGSVVYLWLATRVIMPWFRAGAEVHYARYFSKFGETPEQIVQTMIGQPGLLFGELFSIPTVLYAIAMLAPVAFLPLFSPGRLAVGAPLFGILCLNELAKDPRHHFHAPLVAIVFWAIAAGLPGAAECWKRIAGRRDADAKAGKREIPVWMRTFLWASSLTTGVFFSLGPLGITFWDAGSNWHWSRLYGHSRRADLFVHVPPLIPITSRVASTDFVHPRFTHYDRSYDYSGYLRKVSDYEHKVPSDTDFIVIDTQHRYSEIKRPEEVPEYRDHPDDWELLPDQTEGFFIVLRRRR